MERSTCRLCIEAKFPICEPCQSIFPCNPFGFKLSNHLNRTCNSRHKHDRHAMDVMYQGDLLRSCPANVKSTLDFRSGES